MSKKLKRATKEELKMIVSEWGKTPIAELCAKMGRRKETLKRWVTLFRKQGVNLPKYPKFGNRTAYLKELVKEVLQEPDTQAMIKALANNQTV